MKPGNIHVIEIRNTCITHPRKPRLTTGHFLILSTNELRTSECGQSWVTHDDDIMYTLITV